MAAVLAVADLNAHSNMKTVITEQNRSAASEVKAEALDNHRTTLENDKVLLGAIQAVNPTPQVRAMIARDITAERIEAKQLLAEERAWDKSLHESRRIGEQADNRYGNFEISIGALQIGIVLASVSIVAGVTWLLFGGLAAGAIGIAIALYTLLL
jgi:hypothetical protein